MTILELLTNKIDELKENSQDEIDRIKNILKIIDDSIMALDNEELLMNYDFNIAINLVNSQSFGIVDLNQCLSDVKNILIAKYQFHQTYLFISKEQLQNIKSFKERLGYLKEELENRLKRQMTMKTDPETLENLVDFKNLLEGKGRKKYYTYEMLESFFKVFNYDDFSYEDILKLVKELGVSKNINNKFRNEENDYKKK